MSTIKTIGVLGYHRCGEQDTLVPWEIFKSLAWVLDTKYGRELSVTLIGLEPGENISMQMGGQVVPEEYFSPDGVYDLFYVPGGLGSGDATKDMRIRDAVVQHYEAGKIIATNCSGISILQRAEIIGDTEVTSAATVSRRLAEEGVNVATPRRMWMGKPDGGIWTSAGGSGVHGSTVALIANYFGREIAETIGMMWDTLPALGEALFDPIGPEYHLYPELESKLQDEYEDQLLPKPGALV